MDNKNINKIKNFFKDLLFPKFCFSCKKEGTYLCQDCWHLLEISEHNYCLCENSPTRLLGNYTVGKCHKCQSNILSGFYFALSYKEKLLTRILIKSFKYKPFCKDLAQTFAKILAEHFILTGKNTNAIWQNSVLIPVPAHITKKKKRGYNQSEELARELSKIIKVPAIFDLLIKIKKTEPQMTLNREERIKNLKDAFAVSSSYSTPPVIARSSQATWQSSFLSGKKVFLVDDVYTTGSTMQECARVLRKAGAREVWGIVIAREG